MLGALLALFGPSDEELIRRFKGGDQEAFSELVRRYQDRIYTLCLRWLGEREQAEETTQDIFLALYRSLGDFRGESKFSTWIFRVATNHCKNRRLYRARRAHGRHEPLEGPENPDAPPRQIASEGPGTDARVTRSEAEDLLERALAQLDEGHRSILILRDIEDLPYEEIADILSVPRGTVKSRLHRARADLARVLGRMIGPSDVLD